MLPLQWADFNRLHQEQIGAICPQVLETLVRHCRELFVLRKAAVMRLQKRLTVSLF